MVVVVVLLALMLSPDYSPLASIHDADGDGVADSDDTFPNDPDECYDSDGDGCGDNTDPLPNGVVEGEGFFDFSSGTLWNGFAWSCVYSPRDIAWEDITVILTYGDSDVTWPNIRTADFDGLDDGLQWYSAEYEELTLGDIPGSVHFQ